MNMKHINYIILSAVLTLCAACGQSSSIQSEVQTNDSIIAIREQGSFLIGGTVKTAQGTYDTNQPLKEDGQTLHGDHAYVSYQIPANTRKYPLVFLHGAGQSAKTWESTPDGREGFATLFLRRGFSTYLIDQPRRGRAGRSTVDENIKATPDDQFWFENFRMGIWPNYYENSQFPQSEESLDQFFRQITPNTGAYDAQLIATDVAALMNKIGGGILITHSQGGEPGWHTAIKTDKVRAIVSYEPGSGFVFPEGEVPEPLQTISPFGALGATPIPLADFEKLTRFPIIIYYGDYIPYTSYCKTVTKILTFSAVRERVLKKTNKPVIAIGPYIHYVPYLLGEEDFLNIKKQYGKILLFFPKHTTREGGQKFSIETIIDALKNIAVQYGFQSVFVCMYYYDILHSNFASLYEHAGFKVVTAGHQLDLNFLPRLKSIISLADYTVSNAIGTHTGYCIYMGKVHSIINPINYLDMPQDFIEITKAFLPFSSTIEKKQYDMVAKYWGIDLLKKPEELKLLLEK